MNYVGKSLLFDTYTVLKAMLLPTLLRMINTGTKRTSQKNTRYIREPLADNK